MEIQPCSSRTKGLRRVMESGEIEGAAAKGRTVGAAVGGGWEGRGWRAGGL